MTRVTVAAALSLLQGTNALLVGVPLRAQCARSFSPVMESDYEAYVRRRNSRQLEGGTMEEAEIGLIEFEKNDIDFDGGDSGGGVVGDGNTDLEDQHNSPSIVRGGMGGALGDTKGFSGGSLDVGRGQVKSATSSRIASAGKNYFGRSTGYADIKIAQITDADRESGKMDEVRAQQLENWHNQRAVAKSNRAMGQGVVFGEDSQEGEISQQDLAKHLDNLRAAPATRLDGQEWDEITDADVEEIEATYEVKASVGGVSMTEVSVKNMYNTFAPYQCDFTPDSDTCFTVSPNEGSMDRRSGKPIELTVRYAPSEYGAPVTATLVFETEDFKKVYKFIGST
jgi:hypothetical protein